MCDNGNNGNNGDDNGNNICSLGGGCWKIICKTTLLTEVRGTALASSCLIPQTWINLQAQTHNLSWESMHINFPKVEPEARTLVQMVYKNDDAESKSEGVEG